MTFLYIDIVIVCFRHGENVPFARKGRFGVVHGSIVQHFHPFHLQIETGNREDLTEDEITKRVLALFIFVTKSILFAVLCKRFVGQ